MAATWGVLALQGDFARHQASLHRLGVLAPLIYKPEQLASCDGLVIPGGESTALLRLMEPLRWQHAIQLFHQQGKQLFGTCAGMILLASGVEPAQESLGLIDITVARNAYGRQLDSHVVQGRCDQAVFGVDQVEMVFIRAPKILHCGAGVKTLAWEGGQPVMVQQDNVIVASFHPELSANDVWYRAIIS